LKVFQNIANFTFEKKTVVTIGTFDGVHLGHQKIINKLLASTSNNCESVVVTFNQHPRNVVHHDSPVQLLTTTKEKIKLLEQNGIQNLVIFDFNQAFSNLGGEEFVKNILVDQLNIQKIIIGYDHKFGKNRASDIHDLIEFGRKYQFDVEQISAEELNEITISSTKIRQAIASGNIVLANNYLGYEYPFSGTVIKGKQLGRTINFPTANIQVDSMSKIIPKQGVYIISGICNNTTYNGIMNIGNRPTVNGDSTTIEVHFFDCNEDLYDQKITIMVYDFIRMEQKFDSIEALKNQLELDKITAVSFFNTLK
jgi:riboflavin kinase / FMN adenylyltransferase